MDEEHTTLARFSCFHISITCHNNNRTKTYISTFFYKRLNNCAAPAPDSDDVLVVASLAYLAHKNTSSSTTKTSSLSGAERGGGTQLFNRLYKFKTAYHMHLGPSPFDSAPRTLQDMKLSFLSELPL